MNEFPSGYVFGKAEGLLHNLRKGVDHSQGIVDPEALSQFMGTNLNAVLCSFEGDDCKFTDSRLSNWRRRFHNLKLSRYLGKPIYRDSGGFQLQQGGVKATDIRLLEEVNLMLLKRCSDLIDYAFSLDVVTVQGTFLDPEYALRFNRQVINNISQLGTDICRKIFLVHHFKGRVLSDMYRRLLFTEHLCESFKAFATGGMASSDEPLNVPVLPWVLPLIDLLEHFARRGEIPDPFQYHILGEGRQRTALYASIVRKAVFEIYGVNLIITWDTAAGIAALSQGAFMEIWNRERGRLEKIDMSSHGAAHDVSHRNKIYRLVNQELGQVFTSRVDRKNFPFYNGDQADYNLYLTETVAYAASHKGAEGYAGQVVDETYDLYRINRNGFKQAAAEHAQKLSYVSNETIESEIRQLVNTLDLLHARSVSAVTNVIWQYL